MEIKSAVNTVLDPRQTVPCHLGQHNPGEDISTHNSMITIIEDSPAIGFGGM